MWSCVTFNFGSVNGKKSPKNDEQQLHVGILK